MQRLLTLAAILAMFCGSASAAPVTASPGETGSTVLIGAGLIAAASLTRLKRAQRQ